MRSCRAWHGAQSQAHPLHTLAVKPAQKHNPPTRGNADVSPCGSFTHGLDVRHAAASPERGRRGRGVWPQHWCVVSPVAVRRGPPVPRMQRCMPRWRRGGRLPCTPAPSSSRSGRLLRDALPRGRDLQCRVRTARLWSIVCRRCRRARAGTVQECAAGAPIPGSRPRAGPPPAPVVAWRAPLARPPRRPARMGPFLRSQSARPLC